ncbi:MAG: hypothetical protein FD160_785 [Caulobacteraceae bacterium]|nr:MAG: hypothetical protein FD160_785 [Caulobacteraceae bacterium]
MWRRFSGTSPQAPAHVLSLETRAEQGGAANRTRTCDPLITNQVLYQLSYGGLQISCRRPFTGPQGTSISLALSRSSTTTEQEPPAWTVAFSGGSTGA